jgi:hypothetical protein
LQPTCKRIKTENGKKSKTKAEKKRELKKSTDGSIKTKLFGLTIVISVCWPSTLLKQEVSAKRGKNGILYLRLFSEFKGQN